MRYPANSSITSSETPEWFTDAMRSRLDAKRTAAYKRMLLAAFYRGHPSGSAGNLRFRMAAEIMGYPSVTEALVDITDQFCAFALREDEGVGLKPGGDAAVTPEAEDGMALAEAKEAYDHLVATKLLDPDDTPFDSFLIAHRLAAKRRYAPKP